MDTILYQCKIGTKENLLLHDCGKTLAQKKIILDMLSPCIIFFPSNGSKLQCNGCGKQTKRREKRR